MTPAVTQAQLTRALKALQAVGTPARGLRCRPDGAVELLTEPLPAPLASNDDGGDWTDLAGDGEAADPSGA